MPTVSFQSIPNGTNNAQLVDIVAKLIKELQWIMNNIDSKNVRNIAGFNVDDFLFRHVSGLVGLSGADIADPNAIRIWAGLEDLLTAPFRVNQAGQMFATDAFITGLITGSTIIGGIIKTAETGARIELEDGVLRGYSAINNLHGLVFSPTPTSNFFDLFLYHDGAKILEFIDNAVSVTIQGAADSIGMILGGIAKPTFAEGTWSFSGNVTFDEIIDGKAANATYADSAGTAAAADSLAPSGNIPWGQVTKTGSNVADLATKNLSSMTDDSAHRTVTDTEKSAWNAKWGNTTQSVRSACRITANVTQSVTSAAGWTKVNFGAEEYDNLGEYDTTTSTYTYSGTDTGIVNLKVHVDVQSQPANTQLKLRALKNGTSEYRMAVQTDPGTDTGIQGSVDIRMATTDTIIVQIISSNNITLGTFSGSTITRTA